VVCQRQRVCARVYAQLCISVSAHQHVCVFVCARHRLRVTEHNILVLCKYYSRVRFSRLAQLLDLSEADAESRLSDMVVSGAVHAKIDRPAGEQRHVELGQSGGL
jgi:PCI domain